LIKAFTIAALVVALAAGAFASTITFDNLDLIHIPNGAPSTTSGPATEYPSTVTVSGFVGVTAFVSLSLGDLSHTHLGDIQMILADPTGQTLEIMDRVGGSSDVFACNLIFSDTGAAGFGSSQPACGGNYLPGNGDNSSLPGPAPGGPYGTAFSVFNGFNPNGTWSLYINDAADGDYGELHAWSVTITDDPPQVPEPTTFGLVGLGLAGVSFFAGKRQAARK